MKTLKLCAFLLAAAGFALLTGPDPLTRRTRAEPTPAGIQDGSNVKLKVRLVAADEKDAEQDDEDPVLSQFMQQKLDASSRILEGLMTDDFKMIQDNADNLLKMSREEKWRASNDMMYLQHSTQFRNVVDDLSKKAARKSTDGASLAWVNVTMSCIQCHQWVRNVILAENGGEDAKARLAALANLP